MANYNLKDGLSSGQIKSEDFSGGVLAVASSEIGLAELAASSVDSSKILNASVQQADLTMLLQSGTYTCDGAPTWTSYSTAYSAAPKVFPVPTQAAGLAPILTTTVGAGSFAISGAIAHTGNYLAWGAP